MRLRILLGFALMGLLAPASARGDVVVDGRGWGHAVGMSQWGAHGFAQFEDRSFRWILGYYYSGTRVRPVSPVRMRVRLKHSRAPKICSARRARAAGGRTIRLSERRSYRFRPWGDDRLEVIDTRTGRRRARLGAPVRVSGGASTCLRGRAENGRFHHHYRGALRLYRDGDAVLTVNDVHVRHYLYSVVPSEMPSSWPREALRAQAVAARSYALRSRRPWLTWDVWPDVRSQVYGGVEEETDAARTAVRDTERLVVLDGDAVAATYFFSTSGGRTAAVEEVWSSPPVSYLRSVPDPYDHLSPHHEWHVELSDDDARRKLRSVLDGRLEDIEVVSRTASGRAATVRVTGSEGERDVAASTIRTLLRLRSTWFSIDRRD